MSVIFNPIGYKITLSASFIHTKITKIMVKFIHVFKQCKV